MVTIVSEEAAGGRLAGGLSSGQRCHSSDALNPLTEWRFSEQVENGTPSTSPPYWDTDDSDDDGGSKPPELYGKYTWKIEKFSQITKRELRSNAFEVGGYKWYILIYPQGCDVCNHLSLFLCVANHDKLLPGWSHFAQFTIAVVNKDPKKSKYSDTLHRFWKKEHDWGWKRFMELSKVSDGFVDADTLIIKAQVQVIREKAERPFRCLDCQYRRELVRVYLTNVEQICRRFVEERRGKLEKLIEDKARWSSFCAFWLGMDQSTRRRMSREKKDTILKVAVKQFFIEKEVTSTLVMDSLYSGLKALDSQSKNKKGKATLLEGEETPPPIIRIEKDMFVLVDDVLLLLEKAAMEPLPPKDDKGPQNRTKDGGSGEDFSIDSIERDERRLTELGRRTVEIFVLAHIFSNKIEVAYQEAVALRRQEELIREEEAAWLAESEQKAKRGVGEKDKKSKKKQGKQKRNNRKAKDKLKDEKPVVTVHDKQLHENLSAEGKDPEEPQVMTKKDDALEDVSDVSDIAECAADLVQPDSEDREGSPTNWDTDTSEIHPPAEASGSEVSSISTLHNGGVDKRSSSVMDDSSSTCSTDSAPSVVMNGSYRSNSFVNYKSKKSPARGKNQRGKGTFENRRDPNEADSRPTESAAEVNLVNDASRNRKVVEANEFKGALTSLQDRTKWPELNSIKKEDESSVSQRKQNNKDNAQTRSNTKNVASLPSLKSPPRNTTSVTAVQPKPDLKTTRPTDLVSPRKTSPNEQHQSDKVPSSPNTSPTSNTPRVDSPMATVSKPTEKLTVQQPVGLSSAPLIPGTHSATPVTSMVQVAAPSAPFLSRSISATGTSVPNPSLVTAPAYDPQSYRNAIAGNSFTAISGGFTLPPHTTNSVVNKSTSFSQRPTTVPNPKLHSNAFERTESNSDNSGITFAATSREEVLNGQSWMDSSQSQYLNMYRPLNNGAHGLFPSEFSVGTSGQLQNALADEFPHLDIINDLLADEQVSGKTHAEMDFPSFNRQLTYPTNVNLSSEDVSTGSSSGFDRPQRYLDDSFQQKYGPGSPYNSVRDFIPQGNNSVSYVNGQIDSLVPNQWQMLGPDLSLLGLRSSGVDGYSYNPLDYSNMACGVNGYSMFRSSNGH
ncbi:hypothetical protein RND81_05G069700 [Saponaria officinalis]|uniref:MATH domain-containing protein n=1 Tax=Saponaria officinalis TaxID=3572 RepID=A0AAW1KYB9_SAPOF